MIDVTELVVRGVSVASAGPPWKDVAACRGVNGRDFFPPLGGERRRERREREARAKQVCADCSVRTECLHAALANDERYGVWGGLTDTERARLRPVW